MHLASKISLNLGSVGRKFCRDFLKARFFDFFFVICYFLLLLPNQEQLNVHWRCMWFLSYKFGGNIRLRTWNWKLIFTLDISDSRLKNEKPRVLLNNKEDSILHIHMLKIKAPIFIVSSYLSQFKEKQFCIKNFMWYAITIVITIIHRYYW